MTLVTVDSFSISVYRLKKEGKRKKRNKKNIFFLYRLSSQKRMRHLRIVLVSVYIFETIIKKNITRSERRKRSNRMFAPDSVSISSRLTSSELIVKSECCT